MEPVRYKPADVVRWLEMGAADTRKNAMRHGRSVIKREGMRTIGKDIRQAAGAIVDIGKSAITEMVHKQVESTEYLLLDDTFETKGKTIKYSDVKRIEARPGDQFMVELAQGSLSIKPIAHLVSGRIKVPIGWLRNGLEVPYVLLVEELSARCGVEVRYS